MPATSSVDASRPGHRVDLRTIRIVLGAVWLLDGLLQLQPRMFTSAFVNRVILASAAGQPSWLAGAITGVIVGFTPCPAGTHGGRTPFMTHVWQVPVPGGPLAIDPSDLVVMEAAIEAQGEGLAPITPKDGRPYYRTASAPVGAF